RSGSSGSRRPHRRPVGQPRSHGRPPPGAALRLLGAGPPPNWCHVNRLGADEVSPVLTGRGVDVAPPPGAHGGDGARLAAPPAVPPYPRPLRPSPGPGRWRSNPNHPLGTLAAVTDRAAVWDEAFWPLATGTWTRGDADRSAIVVGSLTKVFACPGLRVGYVLA